MGTTNWEILSQNEYDAESELCVIAEKAIFAGLAAENVRCGGEISLLFIGDDEMQELNKEYRGIDNTTDCLSFPLYDSDDLYILDTDGGYVALGDIVINVDKAKVQAAEYGHSVEREIGFLVVHSLLHLLGYDHYGDIEETKKMRDQEKKILEELGFSDD